MSTTPATGHRVATVHSSQTVTVEIDGVVVAKSSRPVVLFESNIPVRYYLPPDDVDMALLEPTETHTTCPYKGEASYWSYRGPDGTATGWPDIAWGYPEPIDAVADIAGHLSFYDSVVKVVVEGDVPEQPAD